MPYYPNDVCCCICSLALQTRLFAPPQNVDLRVFLCESYELRVSHLGLMTDAMTNLPAVRNVIVLISLLLSCGTTKAQIQPYSPISPTETKECQDFSAKLEAYAADLTNQHQKCLDENKPDRPNETPGSGICSRTRCQSLHDYVYGDLPWSVPELRKQVSACYERVKEYQADEARKAKEKADREAQEKQEEAEKAAEAARRKQQRDARDSQDKQEAAKRAAKEQADKDAEDAQRKAEQDGIAAQQRRSYAPPPSQVQSAQPQSEQNSRSSGIVDPFKGTKSANPPKQQVASNATIVDPFAKTDSLVDPFGSSAGGKTNDSSEKDKAVFDFSTEAVKQATEHELSKLDQEMSRINSASGKTISHAKANEMIAGIQDTKSVITGVNRLITGGQYAVIVKNIVSAESQGKRDEAEGELIKQIASDVIPKDFIKEGATKVTVRLFGERVAPYLVEGASATISAGAIILDSSKTDRNPNDIIHDSSGKVSLTEKQSALMDMWKGYERRQAQTNSSDKTLQRELWLNSNIVYNQCLEAKGNCEQWKSLVGPK